MLILTDKQVRELEEFLQELPGKYYLPVLKLFQKFAQENQEANKEAKPEAKPMSVVNDIKSEGQAVPQS